MPPAQLPVCLPECHDCAAPLARETAARNSGYCSRCLTSHPDAWQRLRDLQRVELLERQAAAIRRRQRGRR